MARNSPLTEKELAKLYVKVTSGREEPDMAIFHTPYGPVFMGKPDKVNGDPRAKAYMVGFMDGVQIEEERAKNEIRKSGTKSKTR